MRIPCPICISDVCSVRFELYDDRYGYPGLYPMMHCRCCGHCFLIADLDPDKIKALYTNYYPRSSFRLADFRPSKVVRGLGDWFNGASRAAYSWVPENVRVLDIGCGFGETLGYHKARGCDVQGVEADDNIKRVADRYGFKVQVGLFDPDKYESDFFDYVTLDQVLEHMVDPCTTLYGIARVLKSGGHVIISTPNAEGWGARLFRNRWINWHAPYHLHCFSKRSIRFVAERAGLVTESVKTVTPSEWLHYQWAHIFTFPRLGSPSAFWLPAAKLGRKIRFLLIFLRVLHHIGINHAITRLIDAVGLGDNNLVFLRKP